MLTKTHPDQLALFEPEGREALELLRRYMREADQHAARADRFELLGLDSAAEVADDQMTEAVGKAWVFAVLLDFEREAGL